MQVTRGLDNLKYIFVYNIYPAFPSESYIKAISHEGKCSALLIEAISHAGKCSTLLMYTVNPQPDFTNF